MAIRTTSQVANTGENLVDSLLAGMKWKTSNLTYSMTTTQSSWTGYETGSQPYVNYQPLSQQQQNAARAALTSWASVCNLNFTEVYEPYDEGIIRFSTSGAPETSEAYYPSTSPLGGNVWFGNRSSSAPTDPVPGNYAYFTFVHELGHALGLKHPHDTDGSGVVGSYSNDCMDYSVMSYRSFPGATISGGTSNKSGSYIYGPMIADIAAVQYMYGANYDYNSGTSIYHFDPTQAKIYTTIWDGGGQDVYDFSSYSTNVTLDLRPGAWSIGSQSQLAELDSNGHLAQGCIANALLCNGDTRSLIEHGIGGSGNDTLTGNQADNILLGGGGDDLLNGVAGNGPYGDHLWGGTGNDVFNGSYGKDTYWWGRNDGNDIVSDRSGNGDDIVDLYNVQNVSGAAISQSGNDLVLYVSGSDSLTVKGWVTAGSNQLNHFQFADGSTHSIVNGAWR